MISPGTDASGSSLPITAHSISRASGTAASTTIFRSKLPARAIALRRPAASFAFEMPTLDRQDRFVARPCDEVHLTPFADRTRRLEPRLLYDVAGDHRRRRLVGKRPLAVFLDPDRHRLVARPIEVGEHGRSRGERYFMLA